MRLLDWTRQTTFRYTAALFGAISLTIVVSFGIAILQTSRKLAERLDVYVMQEADGIVAQARQGNLEPYEERLRQDPRRVKPTGLFDANRKRLSGNIERWPSELNVDDLPLGVSVVRLDSVSLERQSVRAVARRLPNGNVLIVAWSTSYNDETADVVRSGLLYGLIPAFILGSVAALIFGARAHKRVKEMNARVERIVAGDLRQRLPTRDTAEPLDRLAHSVNGMLDEIQTLVENLASTGDDIAHDLRAPLARARMGLERARSNATTVDELRSSIDRAISGIDLSISIVTALLRIRALEQTRRLEAFDNVSVREIVGEIEELYEPFAEENHLTLNIDATNDIVVRGDRDLLFEALANLVDNAVKFTPEGGQINLCLMTADGKQALRISDTGPGVPEDERDLIVQRFYRSDRSRNTKGLGLGLTLVTAIVKLHGFRFDILAMAGFVAEITFPSQNSK
ncbi:ATP-binding protein [Rhizobium sp. CCGE 510]|uniref:sensor histidine kinase n=1 Tax=Rhizobium sp. CCGE 510 TaxID=1132836 RepID=UPI00027B922C|nr:ATP-binding protein [Rhizobium sp. CCGE 510]EJT04466.1 Two-component sensor histidine kinase [Rhizobium sp. CCGE 510]